MSVAQAIRPMKPCDVCNSTRFGVVRSVGVEVWSSATKGWASNVRPDFDVVVCVGCGLTQFFMREGGDHLLETCNHETVDVERGAPYR